MRILLYGHSNVEYGKKCFYKKKDRAIFALSHAGRHLAGYFVKRAPASFTIEAAYVMAIVFTALSAVILGAYRIHDKTAAAMALQESIRMEEYREKDWGQERFHEVQKVYLKDEYHIEVKAEGKTIVGTGAGKGWRIEIQKDMYEPEGFLRLISIAQEGILGREI